MQLLSIDWENWQPTEHATLLFVIRDKRILLIEKKRGLGAGKLNGPGGRLHAGETALAAAVREVEEELCISPRDVRVAGRVLFQVTDGMAMYIHVFRASAYSGQPMETPEAVPYWADLDAIPFERMWPTDRYWYPLLVAEQLFEMRTLYEGDELLDYQIVLLDEGGRTAR